jgi:hypothetical protein
MLRQKLGENLSFYRGVDIMEHNSWERHKASNPFEFHVDKAENIERHLANVNLIFTQSAIEHFEHDLVFFRHVAEYVASSRETIWQVHLMPSAECLATYLWHGYRQYTPATISRITHLFSGRAEFSLYRLGGKASNRVHMSYISLPTLLFGTDLRRKIPRQYIDRAIAAVDHDQRRTSRTDASFYALVIKSNCESH